MFPVFSGFLIFFVFSGNLEDPVFFVFSILCFFLFLGRTAVQVTVKNTIFYSLVEKGYTSWVPAKYHRPGHVKLEAEISQGKNS